MMHSGEVPHWIALILRRFGRGRNLDGDYKAIEQAAIPTVTMLAEWARDDRDDISEMWVFGSVTDPDRWDCFDDDLDVLMIVPDNKWNGDASRDIPREAPLSEHYLKTDIRAMRESDCEPWRTKALMNAFPQTADSDHKETLVEHVMRHGVCVWRRGEEDSRASR